MFQSNTTETPRPHAPFMPYEAGLENPFCLSTSHGKAEDFLVGRHTASAPTLLVPGMPGKLIFKPALVQAGDLFPRLSGVTDKEHVSISFRWRFLHQDASI